MDLLEAIDEAGHNIVVIEPAPPRSTHGE